MKQMSGHQDRVNKTVFGVQLRAVDTDIPGKLILSTTAKVRSTVKEHTHPDILTGRVSPVCLKTTKLVSRRQATTIVD